MSKPAHTRQKKSSSVAPPSEEISVTAVENLHKMLSKLKETDAEWSVESPAVEGSESPPPQQVQRNRMEQQRSASPSIIDSPRLSSLRRDRSPSAYSVQSTGSVQSARSRSNTAASAPKVVRAPGDIKKIQDLEREVQRYKEKANRAENSSLLLQKELARVTSSLYEAQTQLKNQNRLVEQLLTFCSVQGASLMKELHEIQSRSQEETAQFRTQIGELIQSDSKWRSVQRAQLEMTNEWISDAKDRWNRTSELFSQSPPQPPSPSPSPSPP